MGFGGLGFRGLGFRFRSLGFKFKLGIVCVGYRFTQMVVKLSFDDSDDSSRKGGWKGKDDKDRKEKESVLALSVGVLFCSVLFSFVLFCSVLSGTFFGERFPFFHQA